MCINRCVEPKIERTIFLQKYFENPDLKRLFRIRELNTIYNGRCVTVTLLKKVRTNDAMVVTLNDVWANTTSTSSTKNVRIDYLVPFSFFIFGLVPVDKSVMKGQLICQKLVPNFCGGQSYKHTIVHRV